MLDVAVTRAVPHLTVLVLRVDDLDVALPVADVGGVLRMVALTDLPGAPAVVAGLVDLHGDAVPVVDLRRRLGRGHRAARLDDLLVLVETADRRLLVWVDAVEGLADLAPDDVGSLDDGLASSPHLTGVARAVDGLLYVHDPAAFLGLPEIADLDAALAAHADGVQA